ncbi:hypothetical protein DAPPUDRAFT_116524 [Daphnia pulex]|uniref:Uncharacterized protein n=1 Tax=Daphnia pulex TaxID=6669 RepID=E9HPN5_DAPPU|nr:hypothetical protein DAPPUDRAFT_116524 [Daphnia pulex]|eukprot:EFX66291.1 hypothetical protein DAPPUDRAFT_116524 [Daphnia pulex]
MTVRGEERGAVVSSDNKTCLAAGRRFVSLKTNIEQAIERAALAIEVDCGRAQALADQLRTEFIELSEKSDFLGSAFRIDCRGEYEDCDNEELNKFREACSANHDTKLTPHDTIHQPGGIAGLNLNKDYSVFYNYKDYSKIFPGWKDPRIDEEMPVREYILATYNKQIAEKYKLKPSTNIPASYSRNLSSIKEQLEGEIAGTKSN